jgi:toxin YoeB
MEIIYLPKADEDLLYWINNGNKPVLKKIAILTRSIIENPYLGIGKPEALKYDLAPKWSRRITKEHRFVYLILENKLYVYSLRGHYI